MDYVKLISFVGCKTANTDTTTYNIAYNANVKDADSSVGFKTEIYSRIATGVSWCNAYNYHLRNGHSVLSALILASDQYGDPCCLNKYHIYGSSTTTLTTASTTSSDAIDTIFNAADTMPNVAINSEMVATRIDVDMNIKEMYDAFDVSVDDYTVDLSEIINSIKEVYPDFNVSDYSLSVNICAPQENTGVITFTYCIDDTIKTNKNYTVVITNNNANQILVNKFFIDNQVAQLNTPLNETQLLNLVSDFESQRKNELLDVDIATGKIESHEQNYFYDYHTDVLWYQDSLCYEEPELNNAIVDKHIVKYLRGNEIDLINEATKYNLNQ